MPFCELTDLKIGEKYRLTEVIEGKEASFGEYYLVLIKERPLQRFPALGFAKAEKSSPDVYLTEAHAQFGDPTWRHSFKGEKDWEIFWPASNQSWNASWVKVEKIS